MKERHANVGRRLPTINRLIGRTALLKASSVLHTNVTEEIHHENKTVTLAIDGIEELQGYIPFSIDVDIPSRLVTLAPTVLTNPPQKMKKSMSLKAL